LSEGARRALLGPLAGWGAARALGWATAREVDECGITGALRRAAMRALERIGAPDAVVILDGTHDWLTPPPATLDGVDEGPTPFHAVVTKVRADSACATVAAASVQAKCARDEHMAQLDAIHPGYGWASNKGYGSAGHLAAIRELGPSAEHRLTWRLDGRLAQPGCGAEGKMASLHAAARANSPSRRGES
jgi:ribonuclease HII